jgi:hypothetical protein
MPLAAFEQILYRFPFNYLVPIPEVDVLDKPPMHAICAPQNMARAYLTNGLMITRINRYFQKSVK